jgi:DUF4097 and DUF4098 domain-containing protein YvlB
MMNTNKIIRSILFFIMIGLTLPLFACNNGMHISGNDDLQVIKEKTFPMTKGKDLRVKTSTGDITVTSWNKSEVYIKILGDDDAEEKMRFEFKNDGDLVEVIAKKENSFSGWFSGIDLKFEIKIPNEFNVDLNTSGGDIKYGGVNGKGILNTSGVDIWGEKFKGRLEVSTSGGDISLIGSDTKIDAHTSGGDVNLEYSGENLGIDLHTSGGDILVKLPVDFNASATLHTSGGDVYCGLPMKNIKKSSSYSLVGDINNGGNKLVAETSGGDVDVIEK